MLRVRFLNGPAHTRWISTFANHPGIYAPFRPYDISQAQYSHAPTLIPDSFLNERKASPFQNISQAYPREPRSVGPAHRRGRRSRFQAIQRRLFPNDSFPPLTTIRLRPAFLAWNNAISAATMTSPPVVPWSGKQAIPIENVIGPSVSPWY